MCVTNRTSRCLAAAKVCGTLPAVLDAAAAKLAPNGWLLMEFGLGQEDDVRRLVSTQPRLRLRGDAQRSAGNPANGYDPTRMSDCLFCKIIAGQIPAAMVHQDDTLVAFKDINPQAPLHLLIVPKKHIASLNELSAEDDALIGVMMRRAASLAKVHEVP